MSQMAARPKPTFRRRLSRWLRIIAVLYLLACTVTAIFQRRLIYFPPVFTPGQVEQSGAGERLERWTSPSGKPIGWKRVSPVQPAQGRVLVTHGNAGCAFQCGHYADAIQPAAALDIFMVEYPGYADRPGKPSERTLCEASDEAFQLLSAHGPVHLVGESLGTGVAAYLAGRYPDKVAGVALLAPYVRLADVAQSHVFIIPVHLLLRDRFPAQEHLGNYHGPVAMLVAGKDRVIPERFGRRLFDGYAGPKRLWEFPGCSHDTLMFQPTEIWREIITFWETNRRPDQ